ncbi:hypothetical protein K1719_034333 [Acacia pycnantha]|nr:hypothetical protein K1719_034333 [Acacia pycnantha]
MEARNETRDQTPNQRLNSIGLHYPPPPSLFFVKAKPSLSLCSISLKPYNTGSDKPRMRLVASAVKNLRETDLIVLPPGNEDVAVEVPSGTGVYAIYDKNEELQFIGLSRNIAASKVVKNEFYLKTKGE